MGFTPKKMFSVFREKGGTCYYCGDIAETIDHFIPKIDKGTDEDKNLIPSCRRCNHIKHARTLENFREVMARKVNNMPRFSIEQIGFLKSRGYELPKFEYIFWFEKQGVKIG